MGLIKEPFGDAHREGEIQVGCNLQCHAAPR